MEYFTIIRFFGLFIVSLYVYVKILDIQNLSKVKIAAAIVFSLLMSVPMIILPPLHLVGMLAFVAIAARVKASLMISSVVISVGVSLGMDSLARLVTVLFDVIYIVVTGTPLLGRTYHNVFEAVIVSTVLILLIVFVHYLFKIKRLKKGILFWENKEAVRIGLVFSVFIMINMVISGITVQGNMYNEAAGSILLHFTLVASNICILGIYFWWRYHTTALYQQQLKERTIQEQQAEMEEKDMQIKSLLESNNFLSKTVHRDNKLIPAMYNAVNSCLNHSEGAKADTKGIDILGELEEIMQEREGMILQVQREHKVLPSTKIERIDAILNYMLAKATENNIEFDFVLARDIQDMAERVISKQKLETLLADLIENAIIATSYSAYKRIQVTMGIVEDCLEIRIQDSGIPFEAETFANLGLKKATTHADTGGSGIGYMTIFEILGESGASLTIREYAAENYAFTKSIKVQFDEKAEYTVYAFEAGEYRLVVERQIERVPNA